MPGQQEAPKDSIEEGSDSDFSDLDNFLDNGSTTGQKMTKRKMRHLQKQMAGNLSFHSPQTSGESTKHV